jgi:hypothetical protein
MSSRPAASVSQVFLADREREWGLAPQVPVPIFCPLFRPGEDSRSLEFRLQPANVGDSPATDRLKAELQHFEDTL